MAALFEPSLSISAMRAPLSTADAPSMADSLPNVNFGFEELRERMARFTDRFDDFIAKGRKRVLEERNQFKINVAGLQEDQRMRKKDIEILDQKTSHHAASLAAQDAEIAEIHSAITTISQQRDAHSAHRDQISGQIVAIKKQISQRQSAQCQHTRELDAQSHLNIPELDFWETYLGLRVEGCGQDDRLKFIFTNLDEREWDREAWFELDMEKRDYEVVGVRPKMGHQASDGELESAVDKLNQSRDLNVFLKDMRAIFIKAIKQ